MGLDRRFYHWRGDVKLAEICALLDIDTPAVADARITGVAPSARAVSGELCFLETKAPKKAVLPAAGAFCFVPEGFDAASLTGVVCLPVRRPRAAFAIASQHLIQVKSWPMGGTHVSPDAELEDGVELGVGAVIGAGAIVGSGTRIGPGSVIGEGVAIGRGCQIGAHVSLQCALIGDHVVILSGTRLGEAGFGTIAGAAGAEDMPQFGRVIIQDHVTIGANCCIDRGAFDDTVIGERTKIDNLCQIGHNVRIGRSVVMAAFAGLSGTVNVEDGAMMGGRVGIADHVTIGSGAKLAADAAIMRDVPAGETWGGTPARPFRNWMRETAWLSRQANKKSSK